MKNIEAIIGYKKEYEALRGIMKTCKITNEEQFLIDLIDEPLKSRYTKLLDEVQKKSQEIKLNETQEQNIINWLKDLKNDNIQNNRRNN